MNSEERRPCAKDRLKNLSRRGIARVRFVVLGEEGATPLQRAAALVEAAIVAVIVAVLLFSLITYFDKVREIERAVDLKYKLNVDGSKDIGAYEEVLYLGGGAGALASPSASAGALGTITALSAQTWASLLATTGGTGYLFIAIVEVGSEAAMCNGTSFKAVVPAEDAVVITIMDDEVVRLSLATGAHPALTWSAEGDHAAIETSVRQYLFSTAALCPSIAGTYYSLTYTKDCDACAVENLKIDYLSASGSSPPPPSTDFMAADAIGDTDPPPPPGFACPY